MPLDSVEKEALVDGAECGGTTPSVTVGNDVLGVLVSGVGTLRLVSLLEADLGPSRFSALF